jgi:Fibronectin type III domain
MSSSLTFTLSCTGSGGTTAQSTKVTVAASTGTATLSWSAPTTNTDGTPVTSLTGYQIYYGTTQGALTDSASVSGAATTTYEVTGLAAGTWYFAVAAVAADGTESAQSSIGSTTIQ